MFCGYTVHCEFSESVPAEFVQLVSPLITSHFLTNVWSFVASETPATSHPEPGSPFQSPNQSITWYVVWSPKTKP